MKSDYFPIEGKRNTSAKIPTRQKREKALLVYPLGDFDEDPENLIDYRGYLAMAKAPAGTPSHRRGLVIIEFFELNRETLQLRRAEIINTMDLAFRLAMIGSESDRNLGLQTIDITCSERAAHSACTRAFRRLYRTNPDEAKKMADAARKRLHPT